MDSSTLLNNKGGRSVGRGMILLDCLPVVREIYGRYGMHTFSDSLDVDTFGERTEHAKCEKEFSSATRTIGGTFKWP